MMGLSAPVRDPPTYAIIGAAMEVHKHLGPGFLEAVYSEALRWELDSRGIPFQVGVVLRVSYKGRELATRFRADFVCYGEVVLELKAAGYPIPHAEAQILNYLKASGLGRGLLLNFGTSSLEYRRFVLSPTTRSEGPDVVPSA